MSERIVVTGVDGFVGRHVAAIAAEAGRAVVGVSRSARPPDELVPHLDDYVSADLREQWPVRLPSDAPIIHLAGLAAVGASFDRPQDYLSGNSAMVTNMCEALLRADAQQRVLVVSTGAVYAQNDDAPRAESDPVAFTSPYVVSKLLVENQLAYYRERGLDGVVARPFNHVGPGQGPGFLVPDLIMRLRQGKRDDVLTVGNLSTSRDYTDVRDVARAYLALVTTPTLPHHLYNIASGSAHSGMEILEMLCAALDRPVPELVVDPSRVRATDPALIVGDARRLHSDVGWRPAIDLNRTIADVVAA